MTKFESGKYYVSTVNGDKYVCLGDMLYPLGNYEIDFGSTKAISTISKIVSHHELVVCDIDGSETWSEEEEPVELSTLARGDRFYILADGCFDETEEPLVKCAWDDDAAGETARLIPCYDKGTDGIKLLLPSVMTYPEPN